MNNILCCVLFVFFIIYQAGYVRSGKSPTDKAEARWDNVDPRSERSPA